jgi:hypothetical protein
MRRRLPDDPVIEAAEQRKLKRELSNKNVVLEAKAIVQEAPKVVKVNAIKKIKEIIKAKKRSKKKGGK